MGCSGSSQAVKPHDRNPAAQPQLSRLSVQTLHPISFAPKNKELPSPNNRREEPAGISPRNREAHGDPRGLLASGPTASVDSDDTSRSQEDRHPGDGSPQPQLQGASNSKQADPKTHLQHQHRTQTFSEEKEKNSTTGEVNTSRANSRRSAKKASRMHRTATVQEEQLRKISECASVNEQSAKEDDRVSRSMGSIPRASKSSFAPGKSQPKRSSMTVQRRTEAQVCPSEGDADKANFKSGLSAGKQHSKPCGQRRSEFLGVPPDPQASNRPSILSSPTQFSVLALKLDAHKPSPCDSTSKKSLVHSVPQKKGSDVLRSGINEDPQRVPSFDSL